MLDTSAWFSLSGTALLAAATIRVAWVSPKSEVLEGGTIWDDVDKLVPERITEPDPISGDAGETSPSKQDGESQPKTRVTGSNSLDKPPAGDGKQDADPVPELPTPDVVKGGTEGTGTTATDPSSGGPKPGVAMGIRPSLGLGDAASGCQPPPGALNKQPKREVVVQPDPRGPSDAEPPIDYADKNAGNLPSEARSALRVHIETTSEETPPTTPTPIRGDTPTPKDLKEFRGNFFVIRGLRRV